MPPGGPDCGRRRQAVKSCPRMNRLQYDATRVSFQADIGSVFGMGAALNARAWPVAIVIMLTGCSGAARAQDALVLDTYTCSDFLADLGDRGNPASLRRSLMMI